MCARYSRAFVLIIAVSGLLFPAGVAATPALDRRIAVLENKLTGAGGYLAFSVDTGKQLVSSSPDGDTWSDWTAMNSSVSWTSNPVACHDNVTQAAWVVGMGADGQVYLHTQTGNVEFTEMKLSSNLPVSLQPSQFSKDPVKCAALGELIHVFARTQTDKSQVYWSYLSAGGNGSNGSSTWKRIGSDSDYLKYDPFVVLNYFVQRLEVFAVFTSDYVMHTWQESKTSFASKWDKLGGLSSTKYNSAPVGHNMTDNFFNGILQVFVRGEDNKLHHIKQTTCDKVKNPWGPCTWDVEFSTLGGSLSANKSSPNPLSVSSNIHDGIEVFTVGSSDGHLYQIWQRERGSDWSEWGDLGPLSPSSVFHTLPDFTLSRVGWWQAFAEDGSGKVVQFTQTPLSFQLSAKTVPFGKNVTVSWDIPQDEATHQDWIGVYPSGSDNHFYVDFSYVGGTQNPRKDPVPKGALNFTITLPNGNYDFRYMVNKQYDAVLQASTTVYNSTTALEWEQLYVGIARGLGSVNTNITACVTDGNKTVDTFRQSFIAFENREIFLGLHLFAEGLEDLRDALVQCDETAIVEDLTKFIEALIACTESDCAKFLIDLVVELVILYEHIYEIYGDIYAATNCFKIDAYEQGGVSIGRVTNACLTVQ